MKKIMVVFGTRPEAIKLAPVIKELEKQKWAKLLICVTGQHREMLDQVLESFQINPDFDLAVMKTQQDLFSVTSDLLLKVGSVLRKIQPDLIIVQGDTTTVFAASLAAFYLKIKVAHVEAGLRTRLKYFPFPEEINRNLITSLADFHFTPTKLTKKNLQNDGVPSNAIYVTGNTVIDALFLALKSFQHKKKKIADLEQTIPSLSSLQERKIILVTAHRRESFGEGLKNICYAIKEVARRNPDVDLVFPVHLNPNVKKTVYKLLTGIKNVLLVEPLDYESFIYLMSRAYLILTDSGGIQEEAPSLGKPVLVARKTTERQESLATGTSMLVGTDEKLIVKEIERLLKSKADYRKACPKSNPYGDGKSSKRIIKILRAQLE